MGTFPMEPLSYHTFYQDKYSHPLCPAMKNEGWGKGALDVRGGVEMERGQGERKRRPMIHGLRTRNRE